MNKTHQTHQKAETHTAEVERKNEGSETQAFRALIKASQNLIDEMCFAFDDVPAGVDKKLIVRAVNHVEQLAEAMRGLLDSANNPNAGAFYRARRNAKSALAAYEGSKQQ